MGWGASAERSKLEFVADRKRGGVTMVALCEAYGVSREAGYELWRRYAASYVRQVQQKRSWLWMWWRLWGTRQRYPQAWFTLLCAGPPS
jgi:hypothetical protein